MSVVLSLPLRSNHSTSAPASGTPEMRNARPKARRRSASAKHLGSGWRWAPRPGNLRAGSGMSRNRPPAGPASPATATILSSSCAGARFRQPTQVRTQGAFRASAAFIALCVTGKCIAPPAGTVISGVPIVNVSLSTLGSFPPALLGGWWGPRAGPVGGVETRGQRDGTLLPAAGSLPAVGRSGSASDRMSIRQPVSRAASRAFCPSRPIASESW